MRLEKLLFCFHRPRLPPKYMPAVVTPPPDDIVNGDKNPYDRQPTSQELDQVLIHMRISLGIMLTRIMHVLS